jgi:glycosyltransferase involved in cell wall biosynthesis
MLESADLMVLPSNFEGMPVACMEALAAGCGVVASNTSGMEEYAALAGAREALHVFQRGDTDAAALAVTSAAAVPREIRRDAAIRFAEREFSIERCVERYADMLGRIEGQPHERAQRVPALAVADIGSFGVAALRWMRVRMSIRGRLRHGVN